MHQVVSFLVVVGVAAAIALMSSASLLGLANRAEVGGAGTSSSSSDSDHSQPGGAILKSSCLRGGASEKACATILLHS